jgi:hypothetical protein
VVIFKIQNLKKCCRTETNSLFHPLSVTMEFSSSFGTDLEGGVATAPAAVENTILTLNVGGVLYTTTHSTLLSHPDTFFTALLSGRFSADACTDGNGNIFIDRDGKRFRYVLNYLRSRTLHLPRSHHHLHQYFEIKEEAEFFGLNEMVQLLQREIKSLEQASRQAEKQSSVQGKENHIEHSGVGTKRQRTETGAISRGNFQTPVRPASEIISGGPGRLCSPGFPRTSPSPMIASRMENLSVEEFPDLNNFDAEDF